MFPESGGRHADSQKTGAIHKFRLGTIHAQFANGVPITPVSAAQAGRLELTRFSLESSAASSAHRAKFPRAQLRGTQVPRILEN
jgi:hypothetical protein